MPLRSIAAKEAMAHLRRNALGRWPDGRRDGRRLEGVVLPGHDAGFRLRNHDIVLTVGSCFARNIEARLAELGFRVPARGVSLPAEERESDDPNDILNKYNPFSIVNELAWAFEQPYPDEAYLEIGPDRWHDPHLAANTKPMPLARLRERRAIVTKLFQRLPRCRCVIVTLGLIEAWYDQTTGLYLNAAPPLPAITREPDRFRLDILSHDEVVTALERLWQLIRTHGHHDSRLLLTVSPVPLKATYTGDDVLVANSYSKSVLRAAAATFVSRHPQVDYFPSYEAVTLTARGTAFQEDNRHVAPELVNAIMDRVIRTYVSRGEEADEGELEEPTSDTAIAAQVHKHLTMGRVRPALDLLAGVARSGAFVDAGYDEFTFRYLYGKTLIDTDSPLHAEVEFARCVELQPESALAHFARARALSRLQRPLRAEEAYRRAAELAPDNVDARLRLARLEARNGKVPQAEQSALAALAIDPDHADARQTLAEIRAVETARSGKRDRTGDKHAGLSSRLFDIIWPSAATRRN